MVNRSSSISRSYSSRPSEREVIDNWSTPKKYSQAADRQVWATPPRSRLSGEYTPGSGEGRNPHSEPRSLYGRSNSGRDGRFDEEDTDDFMQRMRSELGSGVGHSRSASTMRSSSVPRRSLTNDDNHDSSDHHRYFEDGNSTTFKYEMIGIKEELKKTEQARQHLEEVLDATISEKCSLETRFREERSCYTKEKEEEMKYLREQYEEQMADSRAKLVDTFKSDMQEMKAEWEGAFMRLKDESEVTKRALSNELAMSNEAKIDMERRLGELHAEYKSKLDAERIKCHDMMEELKRSKEEDLERLRSMYEEHMDGMKVKVQEETADLKEEIHCLLQENEKVKMCYETLEEEMERAKRDLNEMNMRCRQAVDDNVRYEKETASLKDEVDDLLDENDKLKHSADGLHDEISDIKKDLERTSSSLQRCDSERARFEKELTTVSAEKEEAESNYKELLKKLDDVASERELEVRYAEALVKQRDNMNAIIENSQAEIEELKNMNKEYADLKVEFGLASGEAAEIREELRKMDMLKKENDTLSGRVESLGRERERYNATVKALKVDLKAIHQENVGPETSLQEHMRLLNAKCESNHSRLEQVDKLKSELQTSIHMLEENEKDRERLLKEHNHRVERMEREMNDVKSDLAKMERIKMELEDKVSDYEISGSKQKRIQEDLEAKIERLEDRLAYLDNERQECEAQRQETRAMQAELSATRAKKNELEGVLDKMEDVKKGLKKKLESAYYDLEEAQREISSLKNDQNEEIQALADLDEEVNVLRTKNATLEDTIQSQDEEIKTIKEMLQRMRKDQEQTVQEAQNDIAESYKVKLRLMEEKHADQDRRFEEAIETRFEQEMEKLRSKNRKLEEIIKDHKESLEEKSMAEIKRRGEFAKQRQELEILRSKERHLETHVGQLEEHISKVVADYEARLQGSSGSIASNSSVENRLKKQVRDLEKKLEVSGAAMKQLGKSSLLMEKENEQLKNDKQELKLKLKKLVDCADKFGKK
jgi:chromosome segregation ATPase